MGQLEKLERDAEEARNERQPTFWLDLTPFFKLIYNKITGKK